MSTLTSASTNDTDKLAYLNQVFLQSIEHRTAGLAVFLDGADSESSTDYLLLNLAKSSNVSDTVFSDIIRRIKNSSFRLKLGMVERHLAYYRSNSDLEEPLYVHTWRGHFQSTAQAANNFFLTLTSSTVGDTYKRAYIKNLFLPGLSKRQASQSILFATRSDIPSNLLIDLAKDESVSDDVFFEVIRLLKKGRFRQLLEEDELALSKLRPSVFTRYKLTHSERPKSCSDL